ETQQEQRLAHQLRAGQAALAAGRIDQPPNDSAWFYFRGVLDVAPDNVVAQQGLDEVQNTLIERAIEYAHELDFESADRVLEDASLVTESPERIAAARREIRGFRAQRMAELEARAVAAMDEADFGRAERILVELVALGNAGNTVNELRRRMEEARVYGGFRPGQVLRDNFLTRGLWTPDSVVVLAGSYIMGSPVFEKGRAESEGPEHRVTFRRGFAIGKTEVTVGQFREFVNQTDYRTQAEQHGFSMIYHHSSGRLARRDGVNWRNSYDGGEAKETEPVLHVSWNDASAYVTWLARGTGKSYRLPSEAEFEYALRGRRSNRYWWGDEAPQRVVENLTGERDVSRGDRQWSTYFKGYGDGFWGPAPVGSFEPNPFGLHDMAGNVAEWVSDCWHDTYLRAPDDGSAWINPGCERRVIRGGYWASRPDQARSASRLSARPERRDARVGFRIARDL
ncbi:MAG: formylglycine-generating enzyme family protein, partial [Xanthomonadales bacterium]|nr:formylglycine-generating enzyme family protein [Xanthomonadales bacterium]